MLSVAEGTGWRQSEDSADLLKLGSQLKLELFVSRRGYERVTDAECR
jgi:hypothetical protein